MELIKFVLLLAFICYCFCVSTAADIEMNSKFYDIEGDILLPGGVMDAVEKESFIKNTKIYLEGGQYITFLRGNGAFTFSKIPSGSYILEVISTKYVFEPLRVEINSKGKFRARKVNYIHTSQIVQVDYPLKVKPVAVAQYFQPREQWRLTDLLYNPMVLMMVLPLVVLIILPRVMNDPEARQDLEQLQSLTRYEVPEVSQIITSFLSNDKQPNRPGKSARRSKKD